MTEPLRTATALGKLLGISTQHVGRLAKAGTLTKRRDGKYAATAVVQYIEYVRKGQTRSTVEVELAAEKLRAARRDTDLAEGLVAPVELLTEALLRIAAQVVPILEGIPLTLKRQVPSLTGDEVETIRAAIAEARNVIAKTKIGGG